MTVENVIPKQAVIKKSLVGEYQHYIAIDWSQTVMAIARIREGWNQPKVIETPSDISDLKMMLQNLKGKKILTFEETTSAHWLYVELCDYVDRILICDPFRNRLLSEGPKTDKIDAGKLCYLLYGGLLKEVYHTISHLYEYRQLVSAYQDIVKLGVRLLNQKSALHRLVGGDPAKADNTATSFIVNYLDQGIAWYRAAKEDYEKKFKSLFHHNKQLRNLRMIPGIGEIGAVKILATVINAHRFPKTGNYLSYCGLVKLDRISGKKSYGKKRPRYSRCLKSVYKIAALAAISGNNPIREYYDFLINKGIAEHNARHAVARYIARISYGILKSGKAYQPYGWR
jgi:transposase